MWNVPFSWEKVKPGWCEWNSLIAQSNIAPLCSWVLKCRGVNKTLVQHWFSLLFKLGWSAFGCTFILVLLLALLHIGHSLIGCSNQLLLSHLVYPQMLINKWTSDGCVLFVDTILPFISLIRNVFLFWLRWGGNHAENGIPGWNTPESVSGPGCIVEIMWVEPTPLLCLFPSLASGKGFYFWFSYKDRFSSCYQLAFLPALVVEGGSWFQVVPPTPHLVGYSSWEARDRRQYVHVWDWLRTLQSDCTESLILPNK